MKRRTFFKTAALSSIALNTYLNAKEIDNNIWDIIKEVQNIIFPKTSTMPSAKEFGSVNYIIENINHETFDKYDANLIVEGASIFKDTFPEFFTSNDTKKLAILDEANESEYGSQWLNILVYYGIEAMLSDPIYGGNKNQIGWKSLNHKTGLPRPKKKYGEKNYV